MDRGFESRRKLYFHYHVEWILFPPKTVHFVPLIYSFIERVLSFQRTTCLLYVIRSKEISLNSNMTFPVFYLIGMLIWRGTFYWKPHLNRTSGSKVMSNWRIIRTIENKRNAFLFLVISHNQSSDWFCKIATHMKTLLEILIFCTFLACFRLPVLLKKISDTKSPLPTCCITCSDESPQWWSLLWL